MKLTLYTDYAIRTMIYLGSQEAEICSIKEVAEAYEISQNHLMKVVQDLARAGFVESIRGRNGGIRLGRPAASINLGDLLRHTESLDDILECSSCSIRGGCGMPPILQEATAAFIGVFDRYSVADIIKRKDVLRAFFAAA
ncbi:Rrf2 family nitric oxide-sensitive transcriptional repressor [Rhizobium sp. BK529]|uniref:Rrf2 family transcriptional regulator n=1 Tax=unclassified Rhizobium TaxID=2613769 RepID=UPI001046CAF6|nr:MULTISPECIES: Rrf2 family transcriptional regulator [unclassified Rhizobium]MBB3595784.1 Rrf2 family nitric oxide-sensitive transcriptional repressor [Rhizobium sp. BK529]TCR98336.1 BadM/Rrf2 family transcriptional regulator [Rhizobium sp. BK418]